MRSVRQFSVDPAVPESLAGLNLLANNLHWCWDRELQQLFADLHPEAWEESGHQPLAMLARISPSEWAALADEPSVVTAVADAVVRLDTALTSARWFQTKGQSPLAGVAYFSPEFGITETLPQYSGGLGILAGDHLKAASDLGVPIIVGIGLLYRRRLLPSSRSRRRRLAAVEHYPVARDPHGHGRSRQLRDASG